MDYIFLLRGGNCSGMAVLVLAVTTSKVCWGTGSIISINDFKLTNSLLVMQKLVMYILLTLWGNWEWQHVTCCDESL